MLVVVGFGHSPALKTILRPAAHGFHHHLALIPTIPGTPVENDIDPTGNLRYTPHIMIPGLADAVRQHTTLSFSRAGGPGGQHVNKVETRVRARLRIDDLHVITDHQKDLARRNLGTRVTAGGEVVVVVDQERSQARNREIALGRLVELLDTAVREPRVRIRTRTPRRAHERRLAGKRRQSLMKRLRGRVTRDD